MEYQPAPLLLANETEREREKGVACEKKPRRFIILVQEKKLLEVKLRIDKFEASWKKVSKSA